MREMIVIETPVCQVCQMPGVIEVPFDELWLWMTGKPIQDAFLSLDAAQRELIMSGTHEHCWFDTFGNECEHDTHEKLCRICDTDGRDRENKENV